MKEKPFHLHLVSDATGTTLETMLKASLVQFEGVSVEQHFWPMIRTARQMEMLMEDIREFPGMILFSLVDDSIRDVLEEQCEQEGIPAIDVLEPVISVLSDFFGQKATRLPRRQYKLDAEYFDRIDALHYSMAHDDGQMGGDLSSAEIILIGISRTSKTPTSMYLANRGFKTANIPYVMGCPLPDELMKVKNSLIVGLTASPERLMQIRTNRLRSMNENIDTNYVDLAQIKEEVAACRKLCNQKKWPVIDVTRRSIEETAAAIINLYSRHKTRILGKQAKDEA